MTSAELGDPNAGWGKDPMKNRNGSKLSGNGNRIWKGNAKPEDYDSALKIAGFFRKVADAAVQRLRIADAVVEAARTVLENSRPEDRLPSETALEEAVSEYDDSMKGLGNLVLPEDE